MGRARAATTTAATAATAAVAVVVRRWRWCGGVGLRGRGVPAVLSGNGKDNAMGGVGMRGEGWGARGGGGKDQRCVGVHSRSLLVNTVVEEEGARQPSGGPTRTKEGTNGPGQAAAFGVGASVRGGVQRRGWSGRASWME